VREAWPRELPADDGFRRRLAGNVVAALAELHTVDYQAVGLQGLGRPTGFVARQVIGWVDRWERAQEDPVAPMEELGRWFRGAAPAPQAAVLLHNDFKLDNLMISAGGEVAAVLDWDMATLGDPLIDLGATLAYWAEPGDALHALWAPGGAGLSDVMPRAEVVEGYAALTGFDVGALAFYRAFGLYRLAVILQQIYARYRRGQTSDPRFAMLGALVPLLAEEARRVAGLG
jgi:aminoglycoside phosphotransferase (APT) family kinase protein